MSEGTWLLFKMPRWASSVFDGAQFLFFKCTHCGKQTRRFRRSCPKCGAKRFCRARRPPWDWLDDSLEPQMPTPLLRLTDAPGAMPCADPKFRWFKDEEK